MNKVIILILSVFLISSCSDKEDPIGKWNDNIKLSTKNVEFAAKTDSITITTGGDWWWIDGVSLGDSTYIYYDREDINLESNSYIIKENYFIVERRDKNTLFVKLVENNSGNERLMTIFLQAGDYFDYIHIKQSAN